MLIPNGKPREEIGKEGEVEASARRGRRKASPVIVSNQRHGFSNQIEKGDAPSKNPGGDVPTGNKGP